MSAYPAAHTFSKEESVEKKQVGMWCLFLGPAILLWVLTQSVFIKSRSQTGTLA